MAEARIATPWAIHERFTRDANLIVILVARSLPQFILSYLTRNVCSHQKHLASFLADHRIFAFPAVTDSLLNDLARKVQSRGWKTLGEVLGLSFKLLAGLTQRHRNDYDRAKAMLYKWKEKQKDNATEEALQNALKTAKMYDLWKKLKGKRS